MRESGAASAGPFGHGHPHAAAGTDRSRTLWSTLTIDGRGYRVREPLGDETIYQIQMGEVLLLARTSPRQMYAEGEQVGLKLQQSELADKYGEERAASIRLLRYQGLRGSGSDYAYEVLNFADGKPGVQQIRDSVSAIYGPVPMDVVLEYLRALETINVVQRQ